MTAKKQVASTRSKSASAVSARRALVCVLAVIPLAVGCGNASKTNRVAVRGEVRLNDVPLKAGVIRFVPQLPAKGPVAVTTVKDGRFSLSAADGPPPGKNSIEIVAAPVENPLAGATDIRAAWTKYAKAKQTPQVEATIPVRYNQNSTLSVDVTTNGTNAFDFKLASE